MIKPDEDGSAKTNHTQVSKIIKDSEDVNDTLLPNSEECLVNGQNETTSDSLIPSDDSQSSLEKSSSQNQLDLTQKDDLLDDASAKEADDTSPANDFDLTGQALLENKIGDITSNEQMPSSSKTEDGTTPISDSQFQVNKPTSKELPGDTTSKEAIITTTETARSSLSSSVSSPATASPASAAPATTSDKSVYHVKWINGSQIDKVVKDGTSNAKESNSSSQSTKTAIVTQNENGPCPLLSIVNVLLFRRKLTLPEGCEVISAEQLLEYIGKLYT